MELPQAVCPGGSAARPWGSSPEIRLPIGITGLRVGNMSMYWSASKRDERNHPFAMQPCTLGIGRVPGQ